MLLIVVGVLCWRVYTAINPPPPPTPTVFRPPVALDNAADPEVLPPTPGVAPKTLIPVDRKELAKRNPFWYYADGNEGGESTTARAEDIDLELRGIQSLPDGTQRARLRTKGRTRYYSEGDVFGQFKLLSIDSKKGTVTVRAEQFKDPITLSK